MAAPTNVYVEAISITSVELWWDYSGSNAIGIYGSTDGAAYSLFATATPVGDTNYQVDGLSPETKYWFKLTDDLGSTFSSVVTVWTHQCMVPQGDAALFSLPRFDGDAQQSDNLNNFAERVEAALGGRLLAPGTCSACPDDGRIVLDCSSGCDDWVVVADEDINSITMHNCNERPFNVEFIVPASTTRAIGGWPAGFGFGGGEGKWNKFATGTGGGSTSVGSGGGGGKASPGRSAGRNSYNKGTGPGVGAGAGGSGCTCVPKNGALTIKSCNANNSMDCSSTKKLRLIACGGLQPYTWSSTGDVTLSDTDGNTTTVTPPTNSGSGEAGTAYVKHGGQCVTAGLVPAACPSVNFQVYTSTFGCNDQNLVACGSVTAQPSSGDCVGAPQNIGNESCASVTSCYDGATCTYGVCDSRSAAMIAAGCAPCGAAAAGATVTVTDANGVQFTKILTA